MPVLHLLQGGAPSEGAVSASAPAPELEREYDANGHYVHGPRLTPNPLARLIAETVGPPGALTPDVAHAQMRERRRRARRALRAQERVRERVAAALAGRRVSPVRQRRHAA